MSEKPVYRVTARKNLPWRVRLIGVFARMLGYKDLIEYADLGGISLGVDERYPVAVLHAWEHMRNCSGARGGADE